MSEDTRPLYQRRRKLLIMIIGTVGFFSLNTYLLTMEYDIPLMVYFWEQDIRDKLLNACHASQNPSSLDIDTSDAFITEVEIKFEYKPDVFNKQSDLVERVANDVFNGNYEISRDYVTSKVHVKWNPSQVSCSV